MSDDDKKCSSGDEVYLKGQTEDGSAAFGMRHTAEHTLTPCLLMPIEQGKPLPPGAEFVRLQKKDGDRYAVTSIYKNGPAKVTTDDYREGWDRIFGSRTPRGSA